MVKLFYFFIVILFAVRGVAAESCGYHADQFALKPLNEFSNKSCEDIKNSKECQSLYAQLKSQGIDADSKALQCKDRGQMMRALEKEIDMRVGCAIGGWNHVKDLFVGVGTAIGEGAAKLVLDIEKEKEENAKCDKDPAAKKALYTNYNASVPKMLNVEVPKDEVFSRVPCAQLKAGLRIMQTRQGFVAMDKVRGRITNENAKYTPDEKEYVDWIKKLNSENGKGLDLIALAKKKIKEMGIKLECYNTVQASAMVCEAIADVASLVAGPAGAAIKAAKVANISKIAGVTANAEKAAVTAANAERATDAARVVGRDISTAQKEAVTTAHEVGGSRTYRVNGGAAGEYTVTDLRQKAKILKEADFTQVERRALMENGIVGNSAATNVGRADQKFIPQINEALARRNTEVASSASTEGKKYYKAKATSSEAEFKKAFPEDSGVTDIIQANYFGLGTEDTMALINRYIQVHGYSPEQAKLAIIGNLRRESKYFENPTAKMDTNITSYRVYRDKELELKLTRDYYEARYPNKYKELDYDKLSEGQRKNLEKLSEEVKKYREQAKRNKWPGFNEFATDY